MALRPLARRAIDLPQWAGGGAAPLASLMPGSAVSIEGSVTDQTPHSGFLDDQAGRDEHVMTSVDAPGAFPGPTVEARQLEREAVRGRVLFWLLLGLWSFNVCDFLLTRTAISMGRATEANGVMSYLLSVGTVSALVFKLGIVSVGVLVLWRLRKNRGVLLAATLLAAVFGALVLYQALKVASF